MTKERLLRRAQLVARLHHPNLAQMLPLPFGAGLVPITHGARTLADFSAPDGAFGGLQLEQIIWLLLDVLSGLRALHELEVDGSGFVHGAISPQYILLGEPGDARLVPVTSAHLNASATRETSGYAAPETLLGEATDRRADLFSVGVLLWEALAQRRLFPDGSRDAVMAQLTRAAPPALDRLSSARWALPLCQIAERAIAVAPAERFGSALELHCAVVTAIGPQLTSPTREAQSRRAAVPVPITVADPAPAPRLSVARWRSATPLSIVIDLPPPLRDAEPDMQAVESEPTPDFRAQPALSAHWQRWQPILAGLAALLLACGVWRLAARDQSHAARQPLAALPAVPRVTSTPVPVPVPAMVVASAPPASASAATRPHPSGSGAAVPPVHSAAPRKQRPKLEPARPSDSDYGI